MVTFSTFLSAMAANPLVLIITLLAVGAIFVNGATDASNAVSSAIGTRSLSPKTAIMLGALCNFVGLIVMTLISTAVADTIGGMVDFGTDSHAALLALAAAMISIIVWGGVAWVFGIPTSQSHSLIAGLTGAAIAVQGSLAGINMDQWIKVVYGLIISTVLGFGMGWGFVKVIAKLCAKVNRRRADSFFKGANVAAAAFLAIMHGAQDGQKFMSVAMLAIVLSLGGSSVNGDYPLWVMVLCALAMAIGSAVGGKKIIKSVAMSMVKMERYQGFAASFSASLCLLLATLTGIPVSTTHTNTTAIMGVGAARNLRAVKWNLAKNMLLTWVFTFPGCGIIGYVLAKLFMLF